MPKYYSELASKFEQAAKQHLSNDIKNDNARLARRLASNLQGQAERLENWATDFAKDPQYALEWGEKAFEAAALARCLSQLMTRILEAGKGTEGELSFEDALILECTRVKAQWTEDLLRNRDHQSSTSAASNLMAAATRAAKSELVEKLSNWKA